MARPVGIILALGLSSALHAQPPADLAPVTTDTQEPVAALPLSAQEWVTTPIVEDTVAPLGALEAAPLMVGPSRTGGTPSPMELVLPPDAKRADWKLPPADGPSAARQTGVASWYGPGFHGKLTASGEVFNQHGMTAAHRTLPIPSYVRVRNVDNGKSVIVRINDRGPYHGDRIIDLSRAAAASLGVSTRPTRVELEPLSADTLRAGQWTPAADPLTRSAHLTDKSHTKSAERSAATTEPTGKTAGVTTAAHTAAVLASAAPGIQLPAPTRQGGLQTLSPERAGTSQARGWWLHLAAFQTQDHADSFYNQLGKLVKGFDPLLTMFQGKSERTIQAGPFSTKDEASKFGTKLRELLRISPALMERK